MRRISYCMKVSHVKHVTALGLVAILLLQVIWLYNMYVLLQNEIKDKSDNSLQTAIQLESVYRLQLLEDDPNRPDEIIGSAPISEDGNLVDQTLYYQEALIKYGYPIVLSKLDSIYISKLGEQGVQTDIILNHIDIKDKTILQSVGFSGQSFWGAIQTEVIPIRQDGSEGIQAILINPYLVIFERMGLLLIATALIMLFVAACIVYQIKVILLQNRIAKLREDFSYAMVHDMKTPLSSIQLGIRLLYSKKLADDKRDKSFRIAEDEVGHLLSLTNKILTLSKMESGTLKLEKETIHITPVIADLEEKFSAKADENKKIAFTNDIRREQVYADPEFLKESISNLIDNAIKYSGNSVRIDITVDSDNTYTWIKVKDNGFGISHQDQKKIFEKFERAAAVNRNCKGGAAGFGLGLNYVYRVAEAHGGKVDVFSIEGQSSEFTIYLPQLIQTIEA